jgi:hypothetical protein
MAARQKIDWLKFETRARATLAQYARGELLGTQACRILDEALAAATRRGNELPQEPLDWESDSEVEDTVATRDGFW